MEFLTIEQLKNISWKSITKTETNSDIYYTLKLPIISIKY